MDKRITVAVGILGVAGAICAAPASARQGNISAATVWNIHLNGGPDHVKVAPGAPITVSMNFAIRPTGTAIDQIEVGFLETGPAACTYDGPGGVDNSGSATLTAPTTPGKYAVVFDFAQDFGCLQTHSGWWGGATPKPSKQYIAEVTVTGGSDSAGS
jgi:hypothetical protein